MNIIDELGGLSVEFEALPDNPKEVWKKKKVEKIEEIFAKAKQAMLENPFYGIAICTNVMAQANLVARESQFHDATEKPMVVGPNNKAQSEDIGKHLDSIKLPKCIQITVPDENTARLDIGRSECIECGGAGYIGYPPDHFQDCPECTKEGDIVEFD